MSATLRVSDFAENTNLFPSPPPIINVPARQHPVTIHFSRRTSTDYVIEAVRKTSKIHARLPPGGVLIFLTGQNEISGACQKLEARYGAKAIADRRKRRSATTPSHETEEAVPEKPTVIPIQADIEPEDMDLGAEEKELALDVDGENVDMKMDDEALDDENDEELGIDVEESEGQFDTCRSTSRSYLLFSAYAYRSTLCTLAKRKANAGVQTTTRRSSSHCRVHECCGDVAYDPRHPVCGRLRPCQRGQFVFVFPCTVLRPHHRGDTT